MNKIPLLGPAFKDQTPENFRTYVQGLYQKPKGNSSSVPEITITFGPRTIVRVKRDPKFVTQKEIKKLSADYGKKEEELLELFKKRKIEVRL